MDYYPEYGQHSGDPEDIEDEQLRLQGIDPDFYRELPDGVDEGFLDDYVEWPPGDEESMA